MPQLDFITFKTQIIYTIISFSILYVFVAYILLPRIQKRIEFLKQLEEKYLKTSASTNNNLDLVSRFYKILLKSRN